MARATPRPRACHQSSRQACLWKVAALLVTIFSVAPNPAWVGQGTVRRPAAGQRQRSVARHGYQFGDLFINKLTGKDKYEFGDLSRFIDGKVKEAACQLTGKDEYKFGDISKHLDAKAKEEVSKMTGKEEYEFGDISKEIARRVQAGDVDFEDLYLLFRGVLILGTGLLPVAHLLPMQLLLNFLDWSLQIEVTQRLTSKVSNAVASELDRRAKGALLGEGNEDYVLGDLTKAQVQKAVKGITGKDTYEFGDISRAVLSNAQRSEQARQT